MNTIIKEFLSTITNLSMLEPKNLPLHVIQALGTLKSEELFKVCTQLYILKNNIPSKNRLLTLEEEEIQKGTIAYAEEILKTLKESLHEY